MRMKFLKGLVTIGLTVALSAPTWALPTPPVIDGNLWMNSSLEVRKAFLVGATNMTALEAAYSQKKGSPVPIAGALLTSALQTLTLDQISARISRWYEANPERRSMPVMGVIWVDMVQPASATK